MSNIKMCCWFFIVKKIDAKNLQIVGKGNSTSAGFKSYISMLLLRVQPGIIL